MTDNASARPHATKRWTYITALWSNISVATPFRWTGAKLKCAGCWLKKSLNLQTFFVPPADYAFQGNLRALLLWSIHGLFNVRQLHTLHERVGPRRGYRCKYTHVPANQSENWLPGYQWLFLGHQLQAGHRPKNGANLLITFISLEISFLTVASVLHFSANRSQHPLAMVWPKFQQIWKYMNWESWLNLPRSWLFLIVLNRKQRRGVHRFWKHESGLSLTILEPD